jgi:hypothetical protein
MATEAQRVLALGAHVELGGERLRLVFDYPALEQIEEEFGGLHGFTEALDDGYRGRMLKMIRVALTAGLSHTGMPPEVVLECLQPPIEPERLNEYHAAIVGAWQEAIPPRKGREGKDDGETSGSPGRSTTTSPPSASAAPMPSSSE